MRALSDGLVPYPNHMPAITTKSVSDVSVQINGLAGTPCNARNLWRIRNVGQRPPAKCNGVAEGEKE